MEAPLSSQVTNSTRSVALSHESELQKKTLLLETINTFATQLLRKKENYVTVLQNVMDKIATALQVDRFFYFKNYLDADGSEYCTLIVHWQNPEMFPAALAQLGKVPFSSDRIVADTLASGKIIESTTRQLHEGFVKHSLTANNVKSVIMLPIISHKKFHGFIDFHDCREERSWDSDDRLFFESLISIIANEVEKTESEREHAATRLQLEAMISNSPGINLRRLAEGDYPIVFINQEVERITGYKPEEILWGAKLTFESLMYPEDREEILVNIKALKPGETYTSKFRITRRDGEVVWLKGKARADFDHTNNKVYIDGVIIDVTETHQKDIQLQESNERFQLVLRVLHEAIIDWNIKTDYTIWGEGFRELFGYDLETYHNDLWSENIHDEDRRRVTHELKTALNDSQQNYFLSEFRYLKANRQIAFVQFRAFFIRDQSGAPIRAVGAMIDLTETLSKIHRIELQNKAFTEIAWLQSHIARAPLANLIGLIEILKDTESLSSENLDLLDKILHTSEHLDEVIRRIVEKSEEVRRLE